MNEIIEGNCLEKLRELKEKSVNCCITSPPYYALRDYDLAPTPWPEVSYSMLGFQIDIPSMTCCLGLELDVKEYIGHLISIFREVHRVLRDDGTIWVNIGDSYWGGKGKSGQSYSSEYQNERYNKGRSFNGGQHQIAGKHKTRPTDQKHAFIKPKDIVGVPHMLVYALRDEGWYWRDEIIWHKPNPMPESVNDRCTKAHEYIFMLSKKAKYYYDADAIKEEASYNTSERRARAKADHKSKPDGLKNGVRAKKMASVSGWDKGPGNHRGMTGRYPNPKNNESFDEAMKIMPDFRNKRSVWSVSPEPFPEAHFATFPQELIVDCIKAGCPEGGIVLDIFGGRNTTGVVARKWNRNYIIIEMSVKYIKMAKNWMHKELGIFK